MNALLNTSVDAKDAKNEIHERQEEKVFFSSRSWLFAFAPSASTLMLNHLTQVAGQQDTP